MPLPVEVLTDAQAVAERGAELIAEHAAEAISSRGRFTLAVSGGRTPWAMLRQLEERLDWEHVEVFQVDERVVPADDADRNLTHLLASIPRGACVHAMPVEEADLDAAAASYAAGLPDRLDLVHLGLGADGHTASLVPGDTAVDVTDRDVAVTGEYRGQRRMTLTYPALNRARAVLWVVTGEDKRGALTRLRGGDTSIPAGRIGAENAVVLADRVAAES